MQFTIDGQLQMFIEIKPYRALHHLPDTFGIVRFEPKSYEGLGSIEQAGPALKELRQAVIEAIPALPTSAAWLAYLSILAQVFRDALVVINPQVGLREPEVDFAAAGFGDVCSRWVYALIQAQVTRQSPPHFDTVYSAWLYDSVRIAATVYEYPHHDIIWTLHMISHAYGRMGLQITRGLETDYVYDHHAACPAEGFMFALLQAVAESIQKQFTQ